MIPTRVRLGFAAILASSLLVAYPARAIDARAEAAAKDALKKAADDFASADYATALARLDKAATTCGANRCNRTTKAFLLRDLGTMQFRSGDGAAAANSFADALKLQPDLDLPARYSAPDVRAAWDRARDAASPGTSPTPAEQPSGDFTHAPAPEQKAGTPLPVYVEYSGDSPPARVVVKYKGAGMSDWGHLDLDRADDGWGGVIPCADVTRGTMRYWIQGVDKEGDPVASSGDPKHPYSVPIRAEISGEAPHLPGKAAPRKCGGGNSPERASETGESEPEAEPVPRAADRGPNPETYARLWLGFSGALDFLSMPAGTDVCMLDPSSGEPLNPSKLYCTNPNGTDFPSRATRAQNMALVKGQAGQLGGGLQAGDVRAMLSVDYALNRNVLVGGRIGYVANTYPGTAATKDGRAAGFKVHVEGRATYLLGTDPLTRAGFFPMGFAGLGLAEFDGHTTSVVTLNNVAGQQPVDVWRTDGPFFLLLGGGARYQFSPRAAFTGAIRLNIAFGNGALLTYGPEIGLAYGF
ncbi:MAG: hypothetical protein ACLP1X_24610 [Polyangiaceae bacterium]